MSHAAQVHDFLYGAFGQHGKACLTHRHHVLMVAEDAQCMAGDGARAYMENARQHFAGDLIHVGYHQQQSL